MVRTKNTPQKNYVSPYTRERNKRMAIRLLALFQRLDLLEQERRDDFLRIYHMGSSYYRGNSLHHYHSPTRYPIFYNCVQDFEVYPQDMAQETLPDFPSPPSTPSPENYTQPQQSPPTSPNSSNTL